MQADSVHVFDLAAPTLAPDDLNRRDRRCNILVEFVNGLDPAVGIKQASDIRVGQPRRFLHDTVDGDLQPLPPPVPLGLECGLDVRFCQQNRGRDTRAFRGIARPGRRLGPVEVLQIGLDERLFLRCQGYQTGLRVGRFNGSNQVS